MIGPKKYIRTVKTIGDKGYDVKKAKVDPLADMSYHELHAVHASSEYASQNLGTYR